MESDRIDNTAGDPPGEWPRCFQGDVLLQPLPNPFPGGPNVFVVHFSPGGRTRPHVHRSGQWLHVVAGQGIVATAHERKQVSAGDVVAVQAGEWHWHGATPGSAMSHVSVLQAGDPTDWEVDEKDWAEGYD